MSTVFDEVVLEDRPEIDLSVLASLRTERERPVVLALDIGTSGLRAGLFDGRGQEIPGSQISLSNETPTLVEGLDTDADALVEFLIRSIDIAVARAETFVSRIDYVAFCCFWHSLVGVDEQGRAVTPLFGWADTRGAQLVEQLKAEHDEARVHARTGARFHPSYWPVKLLRLKQEHPEQFQKTKRWLSFSDYLWLRLFEVDSTTVSMASATGLLNQRNCEWDTELLAALGVSLDELPAIAEPRETCHSLAPDYAGSWPLLEGAAWFPAVGDGAANNVGAGCVRTDRAALMIGTSGAMRVLFAGAAPPLLPSELFCYRADRDRVLLGGALSDGGGLLNWMISSFAFGCDDEELETRLSAIVPDAHGLTVLPFWSGERATGWSSSATGSILGLTARTKPIEILRAAMEAICYRFALIARALDQIAPQARVVAAGNALLSSPVWVQMMADVLGRPVETAFAKEASLRGAALLALEALGKIDSLETLDAVGDKIYEPDSARHAIYADAIKRQQKLYENLIK